MTLSFVVSDRFVEASRLWGDDRTVGPEEALREKTEQALLEIEHLVSGGTDVEFEMEDHTVYHEPSDTLLVFLSERAAENGLDESAILKLYVDLFAGAFLERGIAQLSEPDG